MNKYIVVTILTNDRDIAYPNEEDINKTYSYIFILNKR